MLATFLPFSAGTGNSWVSEETCFVVVMAQRWPATEQRTGETQKMAGKGAGKSAGEIRGAECWQGCCSLFQGNHPHSTLASTPSITPEFPQHASQHPPQPFSGLPRFSTQRIFRAGFRQKGFFADFFYFWAAGFFRGFSRRIFSPHFCGKKCPEKSSRKIPGKSLQNLNKKNPPAHFCRGAQGKNLLRKKYLTSQGLKKMTFAGYFNSGRLRPRQGTEICNFGVPSPLDFFLNFLRWIFFPFLEVYCVV